MKLEELMAEGKIIGMATEEVRNSGLAGREANDALWVGVRTAHAVLKELGIVRIVETSGTYVEMILDIDEDDENCDLRKGPVLVRRKC